MTPKGSFQGSNRLTWVTSVVKLDPYPLQQAARDAGVELDVLRALRVYSRRDYFNTLDRNVGQGKTAERKHRRVVAFEVGPEEVPDLRIWLRSVDMAAPDPPRRVLAVQPEQRQRLRVVDHYQVVLLFEERGIAGGVGEVGFLLGRPQLALGSLKAVVDRFSDRKELLVAGNEFPVDHDPQVSQEGDLGAEDFGDAAPVWRGVDM